MHLSIPPGIFAAAALLLATASPSHALTEVEPGNRNVEQPAVPGASKNRTNALKTTFELKYKKIVALLRTEQRLIDKIRRTAETFDIDPIHMIGAIVGEHTYNVDAYDRAQTYYVKAVSYLRGSINFGYDGEDVSDFIARPQFETCAEFEASRDLWSCREAVWNDVFRGKTVDGKAFPNDRFSAVFFQPFYAGQTFGIGQLNPLTALMMTERVNEATGARELNAEDGKEVYRAIMDPDETLPYIAATLATAIDDYRNIAGFDISRNPGLTATLYNTGDSLGRARNLARRNGGRGGSILPEENYYGWLINEKEDELRSLLGG
ncbi:DUF1402 family protein [Oricola cellulosilytica]|uniref:DUF1402 family protein n=1 Tax=Oricola cellulosilytica TaxID=1429082 RepID=A0A4R0PDY2_9HYPH|nr:DUF1402 family protein [Oricola cellulosilytica]TCD15997.1 DUF1402 family protein [Oricola cellulosilytica]